MGCKVNREKNIPEPELFTSQIEETIDDLFKPAKKIEIDPLTQEIREVENDTTTPQDDITVELSLSPEEQQETLIIHEEEKVHTKDNKQIYKQEEIAKKSSTNEDFQELELDLELEDSVETFTEKSKISSEELTQQTVIGPPKITREKTFQEEKIIQEEQVIQKQKAIPIHTPKKQIKKQKSVIKDKKQQLFIEKTQKQKVINKQQEEIVDAVFDEPSVVEQPVKEQNIQPVSDTVLSKLDELQVLIYTIEWETTIPEVTKSIEKLFEILSLPEIRDNKYITSLFNTCIKILYKIEKDPSNIKANLPILLKEAVDTVIITLKNRDTDYSRIQKIEKTLLQIIEPKKDHITKQERISQATTQKPKLEESQEAYDDSQGIDHYQELHEFQEEIDYQQDIDESEISESDFVEQVIPDNYLSDVAKKQLEEHLAVLQSDVNKILSLEKILAKTSGMGKLLKFQRGIRVSLEKEIERLNSFFFTGTDIDLSDLVNNGNYNRDNIKDNLASREVIKNKPIKNLPEQEATSCPFKQLSTFAISGIVVGIPSEEIVYFSKPPFLTKGFIRKADFIPATKLKPWPWSKLKGLFQNNLKRADENFLKNLEFQVINSFGEYLMKAAKDFYLMLLYDGEHAFALKLTETPFTLYLTEDTKFVPKEPPFEGEIEINENKVLIVTSKSLAKA